MQTVDITDSNIKTIGRLFPNCLTESIGEDGKVKTAIDFDQLRQELSKEIIEGPQERYQFSWPDKKKAIRLANTPTNMTLRPCREESLDFDNTENLYIEGDNLEVLKLLREDYLRKVKMIYIDPPYNTGNEFVYNDEFVVGSAEWDIMNNRDSEGNKLPVNSESNGRYHTDWLNMMFPRLKVARDLLCDDGVLFVSIDDNEVENLRKICDEIFGETNFIAQIAWKRKKEISNDSNNVAIQGEYVLCYGKNNTTLSLEPLSDDYIEKAYNEPTKEFPLGKWRPVPLTVSKGLSGGGYTYTITTPTGTKHTRLWAWPEKSFLKLLEEGKVYFGKDKSGVPQRVMYISESKGQPISNYWDNVATNKEGKKDILELFGDNAFDTPKPTGLIKKMMRVAMNEDDIILDFFSGSATTAHAVMQLNAEDGGHRKFIMVQLPEPTEKKTDAYKAGFKNICEIGKERIRRAGKKILAQVESNLDYGLFSTTDSRNPVIDVGFRVLKLDSSNMEDVFYRPEESSETTLFEDNIKPNRTNEDLLFQVMLECNLPLSAKIQTEKVAGKEVFTVNDGYLVACFDDDVNEEVIKAVAKRKPYYFVMRDSSLASDNVTDNFEQIFQAYSKETIRRIL